jgi:hypothetical protein
MIGPNTRAEFMADRFGPARSIEGDWRTRVRAAVAGVLAISEIGNENSLGAIAWPCRAVDSLWCGSVGT